MNELEYLKDLAGVKSHQDTSSNDGIQLLEEGVARSIDFNKVVELFNATYSSSWYNKHYRGLRFDKGYVEVMSQAKFRTINLSKIKPTTLEYFRKLVNSNVYDPMDPDYADIFDAFNKKGYLHISFFMNENNVFLKFFNAKENDAQAINVFNVKPAAFKEMAAKAKFKIVPSKDIMYDMKSMKYSEERNQIEITMKDNILINHQNYEKTKEGTPKNTLVVKVASNGTGLFSNFLTTYTSSSPKTDEDTLATWLKDHIKGFKITDFRKMVSANFSHAQDNYDAENAVKAGVDALKSEIGESAQSEVENGRGYVGIKRWSKVAFEFDMDNVTSADWTISRTLTPKSVKYIDDMVARVEKKLKGMIKITWTTEEKWNLSFTINKAK